MNVFDFFARGGYSRCEFERKQQELENKVLHNKVGKYTIDSCYTWDAGYETAIWLKNYRMIIVERYSDEEGMKKGHKKWCDFCKSNPKKVYSVQSREIEKFKEMM